METPRLDEVLLQWFKRDLFQTLVHIGVTAIWVMPVITARPAVRIAFAAFSGLLHLGLSYWFYYRWVNTGPAGIDGGPLGFLTWTIPLLAGSLAYDAMKVGMNPKRVAGRLLGWGAVLMALGYGLSCLNLAPADDPASANGLTVSVAEPPFRYVKLPSPTNNLFTMSQRSGSLSYLTFGAGFSLALYALFVLVCDVWRLHVGVFATLGSNALAGYIIHDLVNDAVKPFAPRDAPWWYVLAAFSVFLAICYIFIRHLEKHRLFLRL